MMAPSLAFVAVLAAAALGAATATSMRLMSMHEVMAKTTLESATKLLISKKQSHPHGEELVSLIQARLGEHSRAQGSLRKVQAHRQGAAQSNATGYAAVDGATAMLNQMMEETEYKLEIETESCRSFNRSRLVELSSTRESVAFFNSEANRARGRVLGAQSQISRITTQQEETDAALRTHNAECADQLAGLQNELRIVVADLGVMESVLNMTKCDGTAAAAASFFQASAEVSDGGMVNCAHCNNGRGFVMLQSPTLQPLLNKLRSESAHAYLQHHLKWGFQEAANRIAPVALTQVGVRHMAMLAKSAAGVHLLRTDNDTSVSVSEVPDEPVPYDCTFTDKCTLSAANCESLKDRFLLIQAGILDKKEELMGEIASLQEYCEHQQRLYKEQLEGLEARLGEEQTNLATASGEQNEAESGSHLKAQEFDSLNAEYHEKMGKCCDNQNDLMSERCALTKIRGELQKLEGQNVFITDCEVSEWRYEACDKSCGGGQRRMTRSVLVHPNRGMACPAMEAYESCNEEPCPVDCVTEDWEGWSDCSAECDGGTMTRARSVRTPAANGGEECGALSDARACNVQACNRDCVLADWSEWTDCSKFCDIGHARRFREVAEPQVGTGSCPLTEDPTRLQFNQCNEMQCETLLPDSSSLFTCTNKVDIVVLLDGSGSLGEYGWQQSKVFAETFIKSLKGSDDNVNVALMIFSGPTTWYDYYQCISSDKNVQVDMEKQCNIKWIKHFNNDTADTASWVPTLTWPAASTLTSVALAEAEAELIHGREDASTLVVVITDGWPISHMRTRDAANELKKKAQVLWVPVGSYAPIDMIRELASLPKDDHIVHIPNFKELSSASYTNDVLATACSKLSIPSTQA